MAQGGGDGGETWLCSEAKFKDKGKVAPLGFKPTPVNRGDQEEGGGLRVEERENPRRPLLLLLQSQDRIRRPCSLLHLHSHCQHFLVHREGERGGQGVRGEKRDSEAKHQPTSLLPSLDFYKLPSLPRGQRRKKTHHNHQRLRQTWREDSSPSRLSC